MQMAIGGHAGDRGTPAVKREGQRQRLERGIRRHAWRRREECADVGPDKPGMVFVKQPFGLVVREQDAPGSVEDEDRVARERQKGCERAAHAALANRRQRGGRSYAKIFFRQPGLPHTSSASSDATAWASQPQLSLLLV